MSIDETGALATTDVLTFPSHFTFLASGINLVVQATDVRTMASAMNRLHTCGPSADGRRLSFQHGGAERLAAQRRAQRSGASPLQPRVRRPRLHSRATAHAASLKARSSIQRRTNTMRAKPFSHGGIVRRGGRSAETKPATAAGPLARNTAPTHQAVPAAKARATV